MGILAGILIPHSLLLLVGFVLGWLLALMLAVWFLNVGAPE